MVVEKIREELFQNSEAEFAAFQRKLMPTVEADSVLGVRTPILRGMAKKLWKEAEVEEFLHNLPHKYFDENQLHGFLLSEIKDFQKCVNELERFLPYMDNWATCDQTSPKVFRMHKEELLIYLHTWLSSDHTYTVRFAIGMLMEHFLDEDFRPEYLEWVMAVRSEEYYINMEIAWYMATALAKQWEATIPYIEKYSMSSWVHNKTIQKARESYRITKEQKEYLKGWKIKKVDESRK